ncbi:hypothetical protein I316_07507 [Kwoniella heveanensis BCC8398]|uniref:FAD dependent oxidoreductase domain-containing protein n=1 Tax=Kwoniella heveanensis BCC8398 TaxID=1296120 RepID=A0A1B9GIH4_9TREE|nr:hypothetical protein I316_07507 [Kwoniella heveanensis BCC8398]
MSKFPQPFLSTVSHWQATNRGVETLYNYNRDEPLPSDVVDYVIVGAGMAGATMAYHLTRPGVADGRKVVVLEAKDVASGASGRNGGHCAPFSFGTLSFLTKPLEEGGAGLSMEEAIELLDFEKRVLEYVDHVVEKEGWKDKVDFWKGEKVEVRISEARKAEMEDDYGRWVAAREDHPRFKGTEPEWTWCGDEVEAKRRTRISNALGFSKGPAGSVHPHKLTTHFLKAAIATGQADLFSWAPVQSVTQSGDEWTLEVHNRGVIRAKKVIFCTNAHTPHLFEEGNPIADYLTPFQAQAANVTPPTTYAGADYGIHSYTIEDGPYLIFTPHSGIVLGLHHVSAIEMGVMTHKEVFVEDDAHVAPGIKRWLEEYCKNNFADWGVEAPGEGVNRVWSGMLCATKDTLPLVGPIPGKEGLYIAAGYHGHGMARIPLVTRYLAELLTTGTWNPLLPRTFKVTPERFERGRTAPPMYTEIEKMGGGLAGSLLKSLRLGSGVDQVASVVR